MAQDPRPTTPDMLEGTDSEHDTIGFRGVRDRSLDSVSMAAGPRTPSPSLSLADTDTSSLLSPTSSQAEDGTVIPNTANLARIASLPPALQAALRPALEQCASDDEEWALVSRAIMVCMSEKRRENVAMLEECRNELDKTVRDIGRHKESLKARLQGEHAGKPGTEEVLEGMERGVPMGRIWTSVQGTMVLEDVLDSLLVGSVWEQDRDKLVVAELYWSDQTRRSMPEWTGYFRD